MSQTFQRWTAVGRVGKDPEIHTTATGYQIVKLALCTDRRFKAKDSDKWETEAEWHRCTFFGKNAEVVGQYVRKGALIYVEGRLHYSEWVDKDGQRRFNTEINVDQFSMFGQSAGRSKQPVEPGSPAPSTPAPTDDDIPF